MVIDSLSLLFAGLLVTSVLGQLFVVARLWQIKEWRIDRLREHLEAEGVAVLWGRLRPIIITLWTALVLGLWIGLSLEPALPLLLTLPIILTVLTCTQWLRKRLILPRWTAKTLAVVLTAILLAVGIACIAATTPSIHVALTLTVLLPLTAPFLLFLSWFVWYPIDRFLKNRLLTKAKRARRGLRALIVVALTGSVGKTTTKELLQRTLNSCFPIATPAYVNTELGVAKWFLSEVKAERIRDGSIVIVEMGAYRPGEVALLCDMMQPTIGVVTSIGTQHIALFGSKENIMESEKEMPRALPKDGLLFLNADVPECLELVKSTKAKVLTAGTSAQADLHPEDVQSTPDGLSVTIDSLNITSPLQGLHNVTNLLLAYAVSMALEIRPEEIARTLALATTQDHTFHVTQQNGVTLLDDTHNASPQSLAAGIMWALGRSERPRILCTMGLIEQGKFEDQEMERAGKLAKDVFDRVLFMGTRGRSAFERGYGKSVEALTSSADPIPAGSLVACLGRIPLPIVQKLLP